MWSSASTFETGLQGKLISEGEDQLFNIACCKRSLLHICVMRSVIYRYSQLHSYFSPCHLEGSLVFVTALGVGGGGGGYKNSDISSECEICDKYNSLISRKVLTIKQQQLYKLTVISKWNENNIIYSIKTLIGILM